jgi:hypothetical protein
MAAQTPPRLPRLGGTGDLHDADAEIQKLIDEVNTFY